MTESGGQRRRILVINPNTSGHITAMLADEAKRIAGERADIRAVTAPFGSPSLECRAELVIAAHAVLEALAANTDCDAAIVGAFGDPGLDAAQEIAPMPVFGLGRSGLRAAGAGGRRFAIVTVGTAMRASIERAAQDAGMADALVALRFIEGSVLALAGDRHAFLDALVDVANACVTQHGAEAVLFGGAPFAGIERDIGARVAAPVLDGLTCAVHDALAAVPGAAHVPRTGKATTKAMKQTALELAQLIQSSLDRTNSSK
ncbi:allantoin racemase [Nitrobacteraceae bacterium AZCC 2161]